MVQFTGSLGTYWTSVAAGIDNHPVSGLLYVVSVTSTNFESTAMPTDGTNVEILMGQSAVVGHYYYGFHDGNYYQTPAIHVGAGDLGIGISATLTINRFADFGYTTVGFVATGTLTNAGYVNVNGETFEVQGNIVNNGAITLNYLGPRIEVPNEYSGSTATLRLGGNVDLLGSGTIGLFDGSQIQGAESGTFLTNSSTITGNAGFIDGVHIENTATGVVEARLASETFPARIVISGYWNDAPILHENAGIFGAAAGGYLEINGGGISQTATGRILAEDSNSRVALTGNVNVYGGILQTNAGGVIILNNAILNGNTADNHVVIALGSQISSGTGYVTGQIENQGTISVYGMLAATTGGATLTGGGDVRLGTEATYGAGYSSVAGYLTAGAPANSFQTAIYQLTNVDNTIGGAGVIGSISGSYSSLAFVNELDGVIQADEAGRTLFIRGTTSFVNDGLIQAINGGTLQIDTLIGPAPNYTPQITVIDNGGGTILAMGAGSSLQIQGVIQGGTVAAIDGGAVHFGDLGNGLGSMLDGSTAAGAVTLEGVTTAHYLTLAGAIINTGTLNIGGINGEFTQTDGVLEIAAGGATLTGGGTIVMDDTEFMPDILRGHRQDQVDQSPASYTPDLLTLENQIIAGGGTIASTFVPQFNNDVYILQLALGAQGTIRATGGMTMRIDTGYAIANAGALEANGGTLQIEDQVTGAGQVRVTGGGRLELREDFTHDVAFVGATSDVIRFRDFDEGSENDGLAGNAGAVIRGMDTEDRVYFASLHEEEFPTGDANQFTATVVSGVLTFSYVDANGDTRSYNFAGLHRVQLEMINDNGFGVAFRDATIGTAANETMVGGSGNDRLAGEAGNDLFRAGGGDNVIDGGAGFDVVDYAAAGAGLTLNLNNQDGRWSYIGAGNDALMGIEGIFGSAFNDDLTGSAAANAFAGHAGVDVLRGEGGNDSLDGGDGNDWLYGGSENDLLYGGRNIDVMSGDAGHDRLYGGDLGDWLYGETGNDTLYGDAGNDQIYAGIGNDRLYGGADADASYGEAGNDLIYAGTGNDHVYGGTETDTLYGDAGNDVIYAGTGNDRLDGGTESDTLYGDAGNDLIYAGAGNDHVYGGTEGDTLFGDAGNDLVYAGTGNDRLDGGTESDTLYGDAGNDLIYGGTGDDRLYGDAGNDLVYAGAGNDLLYGGAGRETLEGGAGRDILYGGADADVFRFGAMADMTTSASTTDVIYDFVKGTDKIDLSAIDASTVISGNGAFTFDGTTAHGTSTQGDMYYRQFNNAGTTNDYTLIYIDTDADAVSEGAIRLTGLHALTASDFLF